ncbi:hypothetical protein [Brevibacillus reuszeri]|uniref:hypothetical protein n=1 Tax=Brevibacillus reuszeri TaxID=54915 RepID=UPI00289FD791|nr:hypothetical protein [Brevibacillus reuszeri]
MSKVYDQTTTGLLLVDPYNDFLSPEGKSFSRAKEVADSVNLLEHLKEILNAVRGAGIQVFFVPHHRSEPMISKIGCTQLRINFLLNKDRSLLKVHGAGNFIPIFNLKREM